MYTGLQRDFLVILEEILEGACPFLVLDELMGGQFGVDGDRVLEGVLGGQHVVQVDVQALLVDRKIEDEDGSLVLQVGQPHDLHLLGAIAPQVHVDPLRQDVLEAEGRAESGDGLVGVVGVEDAAANVVGAVGRNGDLQDLVGLSLAEDGEGTLGL